MKKITITLISVIALGAGIYFSWLNGWLPQPVAAQVENISQKIISLLPNSDSSSVTQDTSNQLKTLSTKASELGDHAKNVLGSSIQVNEAEKPLHEKAIEYGQYIYCKQVVDQYENSTTETE